MDSKSTLARIAGALYLVLAVCGGFSELYVRSGLRVPGDPAATARNIAESATLLRVGFATDLVNITCFLLTGLALYALLGRVHRVAAVAMLACNAVCVAVMSVNMLNHAAAVTAATDPGHAAALGAETSRALSAFFLEMHGYGYAVAQIFFGLWLLPLGYLVLVSGYFPRWLGVLLMVGCAGYLAGIPFTYVIPGADIWATIVTLPAFVAELSLIGWLLIKGVRSARDAGDPVPVAAP